MPFQGVRMVLPDYSRALVSERVIATVPFDEKEASDQAAILDWIASGDPLFRTVPPKTPPKHLAVYFALVDDVNRSVMLVDHIKAQAWLLPGGHVDDGEDPQWSAEREAGEELGITPKFHEKLGDGQPFFLSVNKTRGEHSHTDVVLWFAFRGDSSTVFRADEREFKETRWFSVDDRTDWSAGCFDPQMSRFIQKLRSSLG
jgi:8-oxo-dGTP diphosphatase